MAKKKKAGKKTEKKDDIFGDDVADNIAPPEAPLAAKPEVALAPVKAKKELAPKEAHAAKIADSRKALAVPPEPGMKYFEAPDGMVLVGDAEKGHIWYRHGNGGEGCWINPFR